MKFTLVCDSETQNWPKNKNLYYLGYWCLEKTNNSFERLDELKIINHDERNDFQTKEDIDLINKLYYDLIEDLFIFFNKFHKKKYSKRFWQIVVGPWIKVFLSVVYERFISIKKVLKKDEIDEVIFVNFSKHDLANDNVIDLENKASKNINQWNTVLYTIIYEFLDKNKEKKVIKNEIVKNKEIPKKVNTGIKETFYFIIKRLSFLNFKKEDFFMYGIDLKLKYFIHLFFSLKQFPQISSPNNYSKKKIDIGLREKFNFKKKLSSEFEDFVRENLPYFLPTDLIENFENLNALVEKINWPKNPRLIFTSSGYHDDEVFKIYLANKVEKNATYILHQHGSNYFTGKNTLVDYGFSSCDKFISWGDTKIKKCIPLFNTKNIDIKINNLSKGTKVTFFAPKMSSQRKRPWDDYGKMIRDNISFEKILNNLNKDIKKNTILKLHSNDYESEILEKKILNEIVLIRNKFPIERSRINKRLLDKSKILVHSGDGTAFLESLALNKPTISLLKNLNWIREDVREEYNDLIKAKILFLDPDEASRHINEIYYNVEKWWNGSETKKTREKFCEKYSKQAPKSGIRGISQLFKEIINGKCN